ncbi:LuxR family transcriptional regulator [Streptomyces luteolifulvus]|uniref:LuxR family transcriptional regulator n=1 Tax=Streptomyces luteolifulvus TaxID=2615112 RepID=A0A6H9UZC6_9ACTN|nr:LuxR C-terminal-related transcriptional regulator [Streptomyces luteolifulvus]KAB1144729.1 LuxR family transcriptional regulator [Streptomyces luteolifulvus]
MTGIPADLTAFVGRQAEVAEVRRLLSASRLVTLTGVGGVGKTRLALRVGSEVARAFPGGICVVELACLREPRLLAQSVADALGLQNQAGRAAGDMVAEHLRSRRMLLVLDNCEHLATPCAQVVDALLRAAPDLRVLVTSRQVLGVTGEQTFVVPPLPVPKLGPGLELRLSVGELLRYHAVSLFERRAAAVLHGFRVTEDNAPTVVRLLDRLDGLPLAIELAAARMRTLTPQEVLARLDDRFALLTLGSRAAQPRQQTLRELMDWSYALCSPPERTLWAQVSVFSGGFDLEAAESVCAAADVPGQAVVQLIQGLVEKSILMRQDHDGTARYQLLETVREYGQDRLAEAGALKEFRRRHRDHYLDLTARAQAQWFGPHQVTWLTRLRREHANLRAALDFCLDTPGEAETGMTMAVAPWGYWTTVDSLSEGRHWLGRLLEAGSKQSALRTAALGTYTYLGILQGDVEAQVPVLTEYRTAAEGQQDASALAWAQHHLAMAETFRGHLPRAAALFEDAVARHRARGDLAGVSECIFKLAVVECLLGHLDRALALCREAHSITARHGESWTRGLSLFCEGLVRWRSGERRTADNLAREALRLLGPLNDRWGIALCVEIIAWSAAAAGDHKRAAHLLGILHSLWQAIGSTLFAAPFMMEPHQQCERDVRAAMPGTAFDRAFQRGVRFTFDAALAHVLEDVPTATPSRQDTVLTRRESEVADLVALGMTNKDIAARLVIAQRTAENHVERILAKLGLTSRSMLAAWVYERRASQGPE